MPWRSPRVRSLRTRPRARALAAVALALAVAGPTGGLTPRALADGDPGSDVLVDQNLFAPADLGLSATQQEQLGSLLDSADAHGSPVRVAIIASQFDLGAIPSLWGRPQVYARYLGIELSLAYRGRLLIVMPAGFGLNWPGHAIAPALAALARIKVGSGRAELLAAAESGVRTLIAEHGTGPSPGGSPAVSRRAPAVAGVGARSPALTGVESSSASTGSGQTADSAVGLIAAILVALGALAAGGRVALARRRSGGARSGDWRRAAPRLAVLLAGAIAIPLLVLGLEGSRSTSSASTFSPFLDPGTPLQGVAPDFTLSDQFGRSVSLRSFRGRVVILAFNDSECTTVCPLTTRAMLDAKAMLGPAAARVQLLGIDANPASISLEDVWQYSALHGMLHAWRFLTGTLPQLEHVWREYAVAAAIEHGEVTHTPALFMIGPTGRQERVYLTQMNYASIGQLGTLLAREASSLLPGHPRVRSALSYATIPGVPPTSSASIPAAGGGRIHLGPGHGPHLYLFFATWDREITSLAGQMARLDAYAASAPRAGLPPLTAIDEGSVEPSAAAVDAFLSAFPRPLRYPVGVDWTGRVADGYEVQGAPWFVLVSSSGQILWYSQISTAGWPSRALLTREVRSALARAPRLHLTERQIRAQLAGSPAPLAALHDQADQVLGGGERALAARIRALRGYPIVINAWASWCTPCRAESALFASASAYFGRSVAFLGADTDDAAGDARGFLHQHPLSYPSYEATTGSLRSIAVIEGLPTTIFLDPRGRVVYVHTGQYASLGTLESDVTTLLHSGVHVSGAGATRG